MSAVEKGLLDPKHFFKHSATQFNHAQDLLENYDFCGDERILVVGCRDGKVAAELSSKVPQGQVVGLDSDQKSLTFAKERFNASNHSNLTFANGDITEIGKIGDFDLIVSFSYLHYVKDQKTALQNIKKNLKDSGRIILMLYRKCHAQWDALDKTAKLSKWKHIFESYDPGYYEYLPDSYQNMLNEVGLERFKATFTPEEIISYSSIDIFKNFMRGWLPHLKILPQEHHDEFLDLFMNEYMKNLGISDIAGEIKIPFVRLVVI